MKKIEDYLEDRSLIEGLMEGTGFKAYIDPMEIAAVVERDAPEKCTIVLKSGKEMEVNLNANAVRLMWDDAAVELGHAHAKSLYLSAVTEAGCQDRMHADMAKQKSGPLPGLPGAVS